MHSQVGEVKMPEEDMRRPLPPAACTYEKAEVYNAPPPPPKRQRSGGCDDTSSTCTASDACTVLHMEMEETAKGGDAEKVSAWEVALGMVALLVEEGEDADRVKMKIGHIANTLGFSHWRLRNTLATLRSLYAIICVGGLRTPTDTPPPTSSAN